MECANERISAKLDILTIESHSADAGKRLVNLYKKTSFKHFLIFV